MGKPIKKRRNQGKALRRQRMEKRQKAFKKASQELTKGLEDLLGLYTTSKDYWKTRRRNYDCHIVCEQVPGYGPNARGVYKVLSVNPDPTNSTFNVRMEPSDLLGQALVTLDLPSSVKYETRKFDVRYDVVSKREGTGNTKGAVNDYIARNPAAASWACFKR